MLVLPAICLLLGPSPQLALAAPMLRSVEATLDVRVIGFPSVDVPGIPASGSGTVSVDPDLGQIRVGAGLVVLTSPAVVPVTGTTALQHLSASQLSNLSGTFSLGGGALPGETCPPGVGEACVGGDRLGGAMGLTGTMFLDFGIPAIVPIPINFNQARIGQGGSTNTPFTYDAAPWTLGTARVRTASGTFTASGSVDAAASSLTFVTPLYTDALGYVMPTFSRFTLRFTDGLGLPDFVTVPEPGNLILLGIAGLTGVLLGGRRR